MYEVCHHRYNNRCEQLDPQVFIFDDGDLDLRVEMFNLFNKCCCCSINFIYDHDCGELTLSLRISFLHGEDMYVEYSGMVEYPIRAVVFCQNSNVIFNKHVERMSLSLFLVTVRYIIIIKGNCPFEPQYEIMTVNYTKMQCYFVIMSIYCTPINNTVSIAVDCGRNCITRNAKEEDYWYIHM